eukprot:13714663-Alexandrium_andersonii.AAC.1
MCIRDRPIPNPRASIPSSSGPHQAAQAVGRCLLRATTAHHAAHQCKKALENATTMVGKAFKHPGLGGLSQGQPRTEGK